MGTDKINFTIGYIDKYFNTLFLARNIYSNNEYLGILHSSINAFLDAETYENASIIYKTFIDSFRTINTNANSQLADLADLMRIYEERSDSLIDKQRDHYIHSIHVFILGLCIYGTTDRYRSLFHASRGKTVFNNVHEEFLYVWGQASLFHDIGYPIEISYNVISRFLRQVCGGIDNKKSNIAPIPGIKNLNELSQISSDIWKSPENKHRIFEILGTENIDPFDSLNLLSWDISKKYNIEYTQVSATLHGFERRMGETGHVDHGFFSALILMKWLGELIQNNNEPLEKYYSLILESSRAILLHNFYRHTFTKEPYSLGHIDPATDPLSFLLILCDELQEWNRSVYGVCDASIIYPKSSKLIIWDKMIHIEYRTTSNKMSSSFVFEKTELLNELLDINKVFSNGLEIVCTCDRSTEVFLEEISYEKGIVVPTAFADHILDVAKSIHDDYVLKRKLEFPDSDPEYSGWEELPDDIKYSNIKQAYSYSEKLARIGYIMGPLGLGLPSVTDLNSEEVEFLSILEHERWVEERRASGWIHGAKKDIANKISPYIAPWEAIPNEIKEYDREPMRNIISILQKIGIGVYRMSDEQMGKCVDDR